MNGKYGFGCEHPRSVSVAARHLHQQSRPYIYDLETGDYCFHLPTLAFVPVIADISRRTENTRIALRPSALKSIGDWERPDNVQVYDVDRTHIENAAERDRLRAARAVLAAFSDELNIEPKTLADDIQTRIVRACA